MNQSNFLKPEDQDIITIEVTEEEQLFATGVSLAVQIHGSAFFSGEEAYKKALEVRQLVGGLRDAGVSEKDIFMDSVYADVSKGKISQSSSATYNLTITCKDLNKLSDILGVITAQDNIKMRGMVWGFGDLDAIREKLLEKCLLKSKKKADKIASIYGIELAGIREFREAATGPGIERESQYDHANFDSDFARPLASKARTENLGLAVSHREKMAIKLMTKFRVEPIKKGTAKKTTGR